MEKQLFSFDKVPQDWALCFLTDCPLHEHCQRWLAWSYAPKSVTVHPCITPYALSGDKCHYYVEPTAIRMAYGFTRLFKNVRRSDYPVLRGSMISYFGSEISFYRYRRGERILSPEQQSWIKHLFAKYGYADEVEFDGYVDQYSFPTAR